jgi:hypothetical protein
MADQKSVNTRNSIILNINLTKNGETEKISIDEVSYVPIYMYKAARSGLQRHRVIDIEKAIQNYENGTDTSIGQSVYNTLQKELSRIKNIVGENIN